MEFIGSNNICTIPISGYFGIDFGIRKKLLTIIISLTSTICSSQIFITPCAQASLYDQSICAMAGYKHNNFSAAFNYQIGHQYKEQSLFVKYQFNESEVFNCGFSAKTGFVNGYFKLFYPALEIQYGMFQLGLRPTENGILFIEPRVQFKFK